MHAKFFDLQVAKVLFCVCVTSLVSTVFVFFLPFCSSKKSQDFYLYINAFFFVFFVVAKYGPRYVRVLFVVAKYGPRCAFIYSHSARSIASPMRILNFDLHDAR